MDSDVSNKDLKTPTISFNYYLAMIVPILEILLLLYFFRFLFNDKLLLEATDSQVIGQLNPFQIFTFLIIIFIGSILFLIIFTKLEKRLIRVIYSFVFIFTFLYLTLETYLNFPFGEPLNNFFSLSYITLVSLMILGAVLFLIVYLFASFHITIRNYGIILASVIIGRLISNILTLQNLLLFVAFFSVYDIWSVFLGPLSRVIGKPRRQKFIPQIVSKANFKLYAQQILEKGTPVFITNQFTILGIGDTVFFSMLIYKAWILWSIIGILSISLAIVVGTILTTYLLTKISPLPGLPIPILLTLIVYLTFIFTKF